MTKSTTNESLTFEGITLGRVATREPPSDSRNLTEDLRRALIERPNESGALGMTLTSREEGERQAAQFCRVRPDDIIANANGAFRARVYELADDRWGVVVWYALAP
jgi:hypothetical protein